VLVRQCLYIPAVEINHASVGYAFKNTRFFLFLRFFTTKFSFMRKKSGFIIVEKAVVVLPAIINKVNKPEQQVVLCGQSKVR